MFLGKYRRRYGPKCADFEEKSFQMNAPQMFQKYLKRSKKTCYITDKLLDAVYRILGNICEIFASMNIPQQVSTVRM